MTLSHCKILEFSDWHNAKKRYIRGELRILLSFYLQIIDV